MLMWVMSDRAIPRSYRMMQGFGVHTFRLVNAAGRVVFVQVPLEAAARHAFAGVGRGGQDLRRRSGLPPPRPVGGDRGRRLPRVGARRCRSSPRSRPSASASTCSMPTKIVPEELVPVHAGRPAGAQPQSGQLLRRDRAGGVLRRAHRSRHRLQQRSAAGRAHPLVRRHADHAPRRPELPRDPDQRADRAGAQQPARRHAPPGDPPRPRRLRAELARRRLPVPGRRGGLRVVPAAGRRKTRCAASRRSSPTTTRRRRCSTNSQTPVEQAHIVGGVPLRADARCTVPAIRERMVAVAAQRRREELARAVADGLGMDVPAPLPRVLEQPAQAGGRRRRRRCR